MITGRPSRDDLPDSNGVPTGWVGLSPTSAPTLLRTLSVTVDVAFGSGTTTVLLAPNSFAASPVGVIGPLVRLRMRSGRS